MGYRRKLARVGYGVLESLRLVPPGWADSRMSKNAWQRTWSREVENDGSHLLDQVPEELVQAVDDGWFPPGVDVLDLGSGRGQLSAWLAQRGFGVLGAELAESGTELARRDFGHISTRLRFETIDICNTSPAEDAFGALVDRGCYQGLAPSLSERYIRNVATWAAPGAPFLLFARLPSRVDGDDRLEVREQHSESVIRKSFEPWFAVERVARTTKPMTRVSGPLPRTSSPGMAFWMRRAPDRANPN